MSTEQVENTPVENTENTPVETNEEVETLGSDVPTGPRVVTSAAGTYTLEEQETKTMEEDEDDLLNLRAKLYRFDKSENEAGEWKERGVGNVKLLKHKETGKVRVLMRREKTLKICANHYVSAMMNLAPMATNDKTWVYTTMDYSSEEPTMETLCFRFQSVELAQEFHDGIEAAKAELPATETETAENE
eukprot:TRINITY_DN7060_c0_g1_i1.p1 TRINITY_DN7060_c0_g1~~TRINITY_DN7060_c0_g1_i1.p1  ORF type:complete len:209 (-),score=62.25 TRINITY_DN7060_c0_g1_i1:50-616(-)